MLPALSSDSPGRASSDSPGTQRSFPRFLPPSGPYLQTVPSTLRFSPSGLSSFLASTAAPVLQLLPLLSLHVLLFMAGVVMGRSASQHTTGVLAALIALLDSARRLLAALFHGVLCYAVRQLEAWQLLPLLPSCVQQWLTATAQAHDSSQEPVQGQGVADSVHAADLSLLASPFAASLGKGPGGEGPELTHGSHGSPPRTPRILPGGQRPLLDLLEHPVHEWWVAVAVWHPP